MWHEARRQEKILRSTMIDQSKRAERKRRYFENVRKDPEQFMQIHGRKAQVHADLGIARAAEDTNILRPWQGDPKITIDRFDVRSHLSRMDLMDDDDDVVRKKKQDVVDDKEKIVTDFERYRVLIINDYKGVSEKSYLKKISDREFWHAEKEHSKKMEAEKKKKSAEKKSTIGFSYEDSEVVKGGKGGKEPSDEESEEEMDNMQDLDVDLDTAALNPETQRIVNKSGEEFGVRRGLFCALLKADQQALRDAAQLKQIDRQKAQLSGRESKHERMLLRQQRQAIVGKKGMVISENGATATLLGFINQSQKKSKIDEMIEDMDGSDDGDDRRVKAEFITTFGGGGDKDSDDEVKKAAVGPELPSEEYRKILKLSQSRRKDDDDKVDWGGLKVNGSSGTARKSRSVSRSRSRTRSPPRKRRSRSRSRDRYRRRRSGSKKRSRSRDRYRSRSRDRRRSRSRDRRRSRSKDRKRDSSRRRYKSRSTSRRRHSSRSNSRKRQRDDRRRDRSREDRRKRSRSKERKEEQKAVVPERVPEPKPLVKIDQPRESSGDESGSDNVKMLEIRSSMSDSEKEKIEIENRKRRVKLTKKLVKEKRGQPSVPNDRSSDEEDEEEQRRAEQAKRVRMQMSQALKKTRQDLEKEEKDRRREAEIAQKVREELRYIETQERRERERARQKHNESDIPLSPSSSP
ncbi:hypothetical protein L5515_007563 [Caenorhabditis briggsae]|uniref:Suppressor of white apricot N-terminal domain-containing protein n=1 Tax=Caenorhabditis briggsae TaxID=6238 RepID=A0AAE9F3L6_CAEBR|nr:hypothetical protein L5515_007563 [Caenorhabditis briggsae]